MELNLKYEPSRKEIRNYIFLKDVVWLTFSAFGGPQAHVAMMFKFFVDKRKYLTEEELIELNALCQILPGPTSTQTITAIGYKIGGVFLAVMTLLVWITPAISMMTLAAVGIIHFGENNVSLEFARFIQPMAIGFVAYAAYKISTKVIKSKTGFVLLVLSAVVSYFVRWPWVFPILLLVGGAVTAREFKRHNKEEKQKIKVKWYYLILFLSIFVVSATLTGFTNNLFVQLFENFYRNGSLIFGGGQVLIPLMYTEFVEFKQFMTSDEFLTGFGAVQALPGPVFSFCSYIGGVVAAGKGYGTLGVILGAGLGAVAIFTPGTLLIFFLVQIWEELKKIRIVKASLAGINAAASGMVCGAALILFKGLVISSAVDGSGLNIDILLIDIATIIVTFSLLTFTKIPSPFIVLAGLALGFIL